MPRVPQLKAILTASGWMVSLPKAMTATGERERKFFGENGREAKAYAASIRANYHKGHRATEIDPITAAQATTALKILAPTGLGLVEAAKIIAKQFRQAATHETFRERWLRYQEQQEGHWGKVYTGQVERMGNWLSEGFMGTQIAVITPEVIEHELRKYAKSTRKLYTRMVNAVISSRGKERRVTKIEILHPFRVGRVLVAARGNVEELRAVALLLFAGIRPDAEEGEISRMDWETVGKKEIYLPADVTKTGADRHIPITPMIARFIKGHPKEGKVIPAGWKRRWARIRKQAGISDKNDICRHTFASHFLAAFGEDKTKSAMGHTRGSDTLFAYYRRAVTERDGRRYFGLGSSKVKG